MRTTIFSATILSLLSLASAAPNARLNKIVVEDANGVAGTTIYRQGIAAAAAPTALGTTIYKITPAGTTIWAAPIPDSTTILAAVVADAEGVVATTILKNGKQAVDALGTTIYRLAPHGTTIHAEPIATPEVLFA